MWRHENKMGVIVAYMQLGVIVRYDEIKIKLGVIVPYEDMKIK